MNFGRTIFTQIMDYLSAYEFRQCVERYSGNYKIKIMGDPVILGLAGD